jgi:hypothetical protein
MPHLDEGTLTALLDHELEPMARQAAQDHLTSCRECRALYQEIQGLATEADRLIGTIDLPADGAAPVPARGIYRWSRWRPLAWAASVLLALGLGWTSSNFRSRPSAADRPTAAGESEGRRAESTAVANGAVVIAPMPAQTPAPTVASRTAPATEPDRTAAADKLAREAPGQAGGANQPVDGQPMVTAKSALNERARSTSEKQEVTRPEAAVSQQPAAQGIITALDAAAPAAAAPAAAATPSTFQIRGARAPADQRKDEISEGLREVSLEEAVRQLGGSVRLLGGLVPVRVLSGSASGLEDDDTAGVVRVVYMDPPGRELWLDQAVAAPIEGKALAARRQFMNQLLPGDTLAQADTGNARSIRWIDDTGRPLRLTGFLSADSLRALMTRVR